MKQNKKNGYVAILTVLILLTIILGSVVTTSFLSIGEIQSSFALYQGEKTLALVEGCVENGLNRIRYNPTLSGTFAFTTPEGGCTVTIISKVGNVWTIRVSNQASQYTRTVEVIFTRNQSGISLSSWKEV